MATASSVESFVDVARLDGLLPRRRIGVRVGECEFNLETLDDIDAAVALSFAARRRERKLADANLSDAAVTLPNEVAPHFGIIWPAALHLASWLSTVLCDGRIAARELCGISPYDVVLDSALEVGAGLGLPGMLLARRGVKSVLATDRHPLAGAMLRRNALSNHVGIDFCELDWRRVVDDPDSIPAGVPGRSLIVGSDLLYEAWQPGYLATALARIASDTSLIVIADAGRRYFAGFVDFMQENGFRTRFVDLAGSRISSSSGLPVLRILLAVRS